MALTGILLRRDSKPALIADPPLEGEIVYATDTYEYGATIAGDLIWRKQFTGPAIFREENEIDMNAILNMRENDFCYVEESNKIFNYFNNAWYEISEILDNTISESKTWSSNKISTRNIQGNNQKIQLKYSVTSGVIPTVGSLELGEVFLNIADARVFIKKDTGLISSIIEITRASSISNLAGNDLISTNVQDSILELASTKAPKLNAQLITPDIGVATGTSFNGISGFNSSIPSISTELGSNGSSTSVSKADHSHPIDVTRAPISFPEFLGTVSAPRFISTIPVGTSPFVVNSSTKVYNLNSDLLDDQDSLFYRNSTNINAGTLSAAFGGTGNNGLTGLTFANGTSAATVATSSQILAQVFNSGNGSISGTGNFILSDSPTFTTGIITPKIYNNDWCINSFNTTTNSVNATYVELSPANEISGGEIQIIVKESTNIHHTKIVFVYNGTEIYLNEESQLWSNIEMASFDLVILSGKLNLAITAKSSSIKSYKIKTSCLRS
jgi:hypothetical protein